MALADGIKQSTSELKNLVHHADTIMSTVMCPTLWFSVYVLRASIIHQITGQDHMSSLLRKQPPFEQIAFAQGMINTRSYNLDSYCRFLDLPVPGALHTSLSSIREDIRNTSQPEQAVQVAA